jgi:hypothetical protein
MILLGGIFVQEIDLSETSNDRVSVLEWGDVRSAA